MKSTITENSPMYDLVLQALTVMKKASADEIAMEIMEKKGISSEEAVSELIIETKEELSKLLEANYIKKVKPHGEKSRYVLIEK